MVIIPLAQRISLRKETSLTIALESTITDVLNIVAFFALLELYLGVTVGLPDALRDIAARFGVGIILGFIAGVAWLAVLYRMRREEYAYISTLSVLILTYFGSEFLGGSGVLSALLMGLVLGTERSDEAYKAGGRRGRSGRPVGRRWEGLNPPRRVCTILRGEAWSGGRFRPSWRRRRSSFAP